MSVRVRFGIRVIRFSLAVLFISAVGAAPARAQKQEESSHWGVGFSYSPTWQANKEFQNIFIIESDDRLEATEWAIGVSRGKLRGGHWTVSYLSKPFKNKTITESETFVDGNFSSESTTSTTFTDLRYKGVEALKYLAFVTIKRRVQVGMNVGGGIATVEGTVTEVFDEVNRFTQQNGQVQVQTNHEESTVPANEYLYQYQPLFKVEVQSAIIVAPGLKVTVAWGLNNPGTGFRIGGVYLFGAK